MCICMQMLGFISFYSVVGISDFCSNYTYVTSTYYILNCMAM